MALFLNEQARPELGDAEIVSKQRKAIGQDVK